jgi:prephenate dehydratase
MHSPRTIPGGVTLAALEQYSFSDEAAHAVQAHAPGSRIVYGKTIADVWQLMRDQDAYALIPFENSSGGVVWPHLDRLCAETMLNIRGEVHLKVRMCAGGVPGASLEEANVACSHPKGLEQTTKFREVLPNLVQVKEFPSTVDGVRYVREMHSARNIALASRLAIEELGLQVFAEDIANDKGDANITQFFVVHRNGERPLPHPEAVHHAALITPDNQRGILNRITSIIDNGRVDLTSMHSRPIGNKQYNFFVEMTREGDPEEFALMAKQLAYHAKSVKWLGSWNDRFEN